MELELKEFWLFCKNRVSLVGLVIVVYLSYALLTRGAIGIDDESIDEYLQYGLIEQDRVGWSLTNSIFKGYSFLPSWTIVIGVIFVVVGFLFWFYGLEKKADITYNKTFLTLSMGVLISFPYIAKFAIFNGNMTMMGYVIIFTSIALYASYFLWERIQIRHFFILIFCLTAVFLFEKAYVIFYVQGIVLFALIKCCNDKENPSALKLIKWFSIDVISVIVAYFIAKVIICVVHMVTGLPSTGYTSSYIQYDLTGIKQFCSSFKFFVSQYLVTEQNKINMYFAEKIYIIAIIIMCIFMLYLSIKKRDIKIIILSLTTVILSQSVSLVTGNSNMPIRSYCFNYVFFIGTVAVVGTLILKNKGKVICYIIALWVIGMQSKNMQKVYYNKNITFEKDKYYAESILSTIENECGTIATYNKPILFLGFSDGSNINYGEPEETSMFVWARNDSVDSEESSHRVFNFYDKLGYSLVRPNGSIDCYDVRRQLSSMPTFPSKGCVKELDTCIVIKLGDSLCEIIDSDEFDWENNENLYASVAYCSFSDERLQVGGWMINRGKNSYNNNISLVIKNEESAYRIRADECKRNDVTLNINDGNNYDNSGFDLNALLPKYVKVGIYQAYLEIRDDEGAYLYDLNQNISVAER